MGRNALSRRMFKRTGFDESQYQFNLKPGEFVAVIDCMRWGKGKKLVTYLTFEDGRKIVTLTWPRRNFEGLAGMETGDRVRLLFMETRSGVLCVRKVVLAEQNNNSSIL